MLLEISKKRRVRGPGEALKTNTFVLRVQQQNITAALLIKMQSQTQNPQTHRENSNLQRLLQSGMFRKS
jgi:hypothetical protein